MTGSFKLSFNNGFSTRHNSTIPDTGAKYQPVQGLTVSEHIFYIYNRATIDMQKSPVFAKPHEVGLRVQW